MNHSVIGIVGHKRNGKDTIANVLINHNGYERYAFADPLKQACGIIFMLSDDQLYGDQKEVLDPRWNTSPRKLLQITGTDLFRNQLTELIPEMNFGSDRTLWCYRFRLWLEQQTEPKRIVISDTRFEDEADIIHSLGGVLVRVVRPSIVSNDTHPSETEQDKIVCDYTLINDGTLDELEQKVKGLFIK